MRLDSDKKAVFNTLHAVLLPDRKYPLYNDSLASVNLFPVLFNSLFGTQYALHADSTVFLSDRQ